MSKSNVQNNQNNMSENTPYDPLALSKAMMKAYEKAMPVFEKFFQNAANAGNNESLSKNFDPLGVNPLYAEFMEKLAEDPDKFWELQKGYWGNWFEIWRNTGLKAMGEESTSIISPEKGDRRFAHEDWQKIAVFDFIKQSYLLTCNYIDKTIRETEGLDKAKRDKLAFTAQLYANAMSPSNFAMTNPAVLEETFKSGGENLVKGFENLIKDIERGKGELSISATDYTAFKVGENIATTKGAVVYQNELMQLIQYEPTTDKVFKRPMLIIPPWINKYYILDMRPENSYIQWAVDQGHTVFVISWVNPGKELAAKRFEDYMHEGILAACDAIENATGEKDINAVGYCLGGTLLATTLAYLQAKGKADRIASTTFLTTLVDFEDAGDLKMFLDDAQIEALEINMNKTGLFDAKILQQTFKLLRSNDLIWSFVVNNYLLGKEPFPFDLLYWNDDSTNMPAAMQSFYLKNMYRDNKLAQPQGIEIDGVKIDLSKIKTPAYFLSTREDHIAPWQATYAGTQLTSGENTFTLAASGHIAGVVNPPAKGKYCYWTNNKLPENSEKWLENASETQGSWWPHWQEWLAPRSGEKVPARKIGKSIEPAPGSYVKKIA
jgi:polyhydroxyalkanoate synthase